MEIFLRLRRSNPLRRLVYELAVSLLLISVALFVAIESFVTDRGGHEIHVTSETLTKLEQLWLQQWGRFPTAEEMDALVQDHIDNEVLVRRAVALGLDRDDELVRRRLILKMSSYTANSVTQPPSDLEMKRWYEAHREEFRRPGVVGVDAFPSWEQSKPLVAQRMLAERGEARKEDLLRSWRDEYAIRIDPYTGGAKR